MKKSQRLLGAVLLLTVIAVSLSLFIPEPKSADEAELYSPYGAAVSLLDSCILLGTALLFLKAKKGFKQQLKKAYSLLAYAATAAAIFSLFVPVIEYFGLWGSPFYNTLSFLSPFVASILIYWALRLFDKTLGAKLGFVAGVLPALVIVVATLLYNFIPHQDTWSGVTNENIYDLLQLLVILPIVMYGYSFFLALKVEKNIGPVYRSSFTAIVVSMLLQIIGTISVAIMQITSYDVFYFESRLYLAPFIMGDLALLAAAYLFLSKSDVESPEGRTTRTVTSIDIVLQAAELASNPKDIDIQLDAVRQITATNDPAQFAHLNERETSSLLQAYLSIEDYLINHEPLKEYSRDSIRQAMAKQLNLSQDDKGTFWSLLTSQK